MLGIKQQFVQPIRPLPCPRSSCSCTLLPSGHILVVGGLDSNRVDAATF